MKLAHPSSLFLIGLAAVGCALAANAQAVIQQTFADLNQLIPDNDPSGAVLVRTISGSPVGSVIVDVNVSLKISGTGARNGDLYPCGRRAAPHYSSGNTAR